MKSNGTAVTAVGALLLALCTGRLAFGLETAGCPAQATDDATKATHYELPPPVVQCNGRSLETTLIEHLGLDPATTLLRQISRPTARQTITTRFDVFVFDLPVIGALITVETDEAETEVYQVYTHPDHFPTSSEQRMLLSNVLSPDEAINTIAQSFVSTYSLKLNAGRRRESKLGWYSVDYEGRDYRLAYKASVLLDPPVAEKNIKPEGLIDARTGEILRSWDGVYHSGQYTNISTVGGNNCSRWKNVNYPTIRVYRDGEMCTLKSTDYSIHHARNQDDHSSTPWTFNCSLARTTFDQMFGANGPCFDVAFALNHSIAMFIEYTGEYPLNRNKTNSLVLEATCHYDMYYHDAHFDGYKIYVGDASPLYFCPFTSLDMIAHEVAHAWNTLHAELGNSDQDGAISEATADLAGMTAMYYVTDDPTLMWAAQVTRGGHALRDFCSPSLSWLYPQIEHVDEWFDGQEVHVAGGAFSKAYCLILSKCGWDLPSLFKVVFRAQALYWFMSINFVSAFCGLLHSVRDLYPNDAQRLQDFVTSFAVVGLRCN